MRDLRCPLVCLLAFVAMVPMARTAAQSPQPPQFRAGVDLVHLDVSVLDRNRRPVRGLTADDFVVLEDGKAQAVSTFVSVEIPDTEPPTAPWMREVAPDTRRNDTLDDRRLFVIVMDDGMAQNNLHAVKAAKDAAKQFIDRLGPSDLAAVLFTKSNQHAQDYTSDKSRLLKAVDRYSMGFRDMGAVDPSLPNTDAYYYGSSIEVLVRITEALIALPQRRKTLVYIGQGVPIDPDAATAPVLIGSGLAAVSDAGMQAQLLDRTMAVLAAAQRANVNIYTLDPCGLRVPPPPDAPAPTCEPGFEQEFLKDLSHATGGRAAVDTNDLGPAVEQIFVENGSYYLLGFASTNTRREGKQRRLEVKVNRPDVEVRARSGYTEPHAVREQKAAESDASTPLAKAISGLLPKGDVPMQVWAAAYAGPGSRTANVALTLAIRQTLGERPTAITETVDLTVDAFTPEGRRRAGKSVTVEVALRAGPAGVVGYEIVSSLSLAPGRYQLRIGARLRSDDSTGSIYYDLDVPDFSRNSVALSGIGLSATPGVTSTTAETMAWLPGRPTTARLFERSDRLTAFVRVYQEPQTQRQGMQQRRSLTTSVPVRTRVVDATGATVWATTNTIDGAQFTQGDVDVSVAVPVDTLKPGAYLLSLEARGTTQSVRFTVR